MECLEGLAMPSPGIIGLVNGLEHE
jgi:hypothetical protein